MTIRQGSDSFFSKPEVACARRIAGSKPGYTALQSQVVKLSVSVSVCLCLCSRSANAPPPSLSLSLLLSLLLSLCVTVAL